MSTAHRPIGSGPPAGQTGNISRPIEDARIHEISLTESMREMDSLTKERTPEQYGRIESSQDTAKYEAVVSPDISRRRCDAKTGIDPVVRCLEPFRALAGLPGYSQY